MVECPETGKAIRTGVELPTLEAFDAVALDRRLVQCPHCRQWHHWGKHDVWLEAGAPRPLGA